MHGQCAKPRVWIRAKLSKNSRRSVRGSRWGCCEERNQSARDPFVAERVERFDSLCTRFWAGGLQTFGDRPNRVGRSNKSECAEDASRRLRLASFQQIAHIK